MYKIVVNSMYIHEWRNVTCFSLATIYAAASMIGALEITWILGGKHPSEGLEDTRNEMGHGSVPFTKHNF